MENDANAARVRRKCTLRAAPRGYRDAVIITLGTGIGSGIILNGKILRGFNFAAGEMGHNVIVKDGIQCTCGRKGCWERYASASALTRETKKAMQENKNTIMWQMTQDIDHVNAKLAFDAAAKGDRPRRRSWTAGSSMWASALPMSSTPLSRRSSASAAAFPIRVRSCWHLSAHMLRMRPGNITTGKFPAICACTLRNDAGVIGAAALENSI